MSCSRVLILVAICALGWPLHMQAEGPRVFSKRWIFSVAALAGANVLDAHSSAGRYESNPVFRGPGGLYDARRGAAIKIGVTAGYLVTQCILARRNASTWARPFEVANFAVAGVLAGTAVHNYRLPKAVTD